MLHDALENNVLYELGINWNELERFQLAANNFNLQMMLATLPNTILPELGVERPEAVGPIVLSLDKKTSLPN